MTSAIRTILVTALASLVRLVPISASLLLSSAALGAEQSPPPPTQDAIQVTIGSGQGKDVRPRAQRGLVSTVGIISNHATRVTLQFPLTKAGLLLAVGCPDGGELIGRAESLPLPADGIASFKFRATAVGRYRLLVQIGVEEYTINLYVVDKDGPQFPIAE